MSTSTKFHLPKVATGQVEQALRPVLNLIFYHFNCSERLLKSYHVFLVPVVAACSQLLLKSVSKLFENVEWSNSLLRHFKIQTSLKINCSMAAISAFGVMQRSQIFSLFFRNRIQCIALYQLHNSQTLLNLRRGYYSSLHMGDTGGESFRPSTLVFNVAKTTLVM